MTNTGANVAAVAAALQESGDMAMPLPIAGAGRRSTVSKHGLSRSAVVGSLPSPPASLPTRRFGAGPGEVAGMQDGSAIDDEPNMSGDEADGSASSTAFQKARVRRASDGQPLVKEGGRKINRPELRCEKCGKGYKHSSCLNKHLFVPIFLSLPFLTTWYPRAEPALCPLPHCRYHFHHNSLLPAADPWVLAR
jgi:hypothetical protein